MKKLILLFIVCTFSWFTVAQVIEHHYHFENPDIEHFKNYQILSFQHTQQLAKPGNPLIPYQDIRLLLPPGKSASHIEIIRKNEIPLTGEFTLYPKQHARPISEGESGVFLKNTALYEADINYPGKPEGKLTTSFLNGYAIALSAFSPVKYNPANKTISYFADVTVRIHLQSGGKAENALQMFNSSAKVKKQVRQFVQNPEKAMHYPAPKTLENYHVLLITRSEYEEMFDEMKALNLENGLKTITITAETIQDDYTGIDLPEKIRNCIISEYQNNGIEHVVLGGDAEIIPYRGFYCEVQSSSLYTDDNIPSDLYYSSLDGTWNDDGDNLWGEIGEDDLLPEVSVARIPFSNETDLGNYLVKYMDYQTTPVYNELNKSLLAGEHLWDDPLTYGGDYLDLMIGYHEDNGYTTDGIPEDAGYEKMYDRDLGYWSGSELIAKINEGFPFIHHVGHANASYNMRLYSSDINNSNFGSLDGSTHNFTLVYSHGCISGSFDYDDCIGEKMVNIENFAVAFIGNSRYGWFNEGQTEGPSQHIHREFIDALYNQKQAKVGETHRLSKLNTAPWVNAEDQWEEGALRWCFYDCNVLGDPTLNIWTDEPRELNVEYQNTLEIGTESISLTITENENPAENVMCSFHKDGVIYGLAETNADGEAIIEIDPDFSSLGEATIFISGYNCLRTSYAVNVVASDEPYMVLTNYEIIDDNNQYPEYSENATLSISLANIGLAVGDDISASLLSDDPYVNYSENLAWFGSMQPGDTNTLDSIFSLTFADDVPDQHVSTLYLVINGDGGFEWTAEISFMLSAPHLSIGNILVNDTQGNNNGFFDAGETIELSFEITNTGHAASEVITAILENETANVDIASSEIELESCLPDETLYANFTIEVNDDVGMGEMIQLNLTTTAGSYMAEHLFQYHAGIQIEGFESAGLDLFSWLNQGDAEWVITDEAYEGEYALKSGDLSDEELSSLSLETDVINDGEISFAYKVSSEEGWDYLRFYINNMLIEEWSGEVDWSVQSYSVDAGRNTFTWQYEKDYSISSGEDCAWLDNIVFPPMTDPNAPVFSIDIDSLHCEMLPDHADTILLQLHNTGGGTIPFSIETTSQVSWMEMDIASGTINAADYVDVEIVISSGGMSEGDYNCNLIIHEIGITNIPVTLRVNATAVMDLALKESFAVYPNPAQNNAFVTFNLSEPDVVQLEILNNAGEVVIHIQNKEYTTGRHALRLSDLPAPGLYFIRISSSKEKLIKKFIIAE